MTKPVGPHELWPLAAAAGPAVSAIHCTTRPTAALV